MYAIPKLSGQQAVFLEIVTPALMEVFGFASCAKKDNISIKTKEERFYLTFYTSL